MPVDVSKIGSPEEVRNERDFLYWRNKELEAANKQLLSRNDHLEKRHRRTGEMIEFWHGKFLTLRHENNKLRHELWQRKGRNARETTAGCGSGDRPTSA